MGNTRILLLEEATWQVVLYRIGKARSGRFAMQASCQSVGVYPTQRVDRLDIYGGCRVEYIKRWGREIARYHGMRPLDRRGTGVFMRSCGRSDV